MEQMDILQAHFSDLRHDSLEAVEISLDLGELSLSSQVSESFDDLIRRERHHAGNLYPLRKCRHVLREGGTLRLTDTHPGAGDEGYQELLTVLLRAGGFTDVTPIGNRPVVVQARKRPGNGGGAGVRDGRARDHDAGGPGADPRVRA